MGNSSSGVASHENSQYKDHHGFRDYHHHDNQQRNGRNRMRKSYLPPQSYMGKLVPPQKVLPNVSPVDAAQQLKPTFNGVILHNGGTISGRKINSPTQIIIDHEKLRKKSSIEDTGISGISSPDLSLENFNESRELSPKLGAKFPRRLRNYESEPELIGSQSNNLLPQNFIVTNNNTKPKESNRNIPISKKQKAPSPPRKTSSSSSKLYKKKSEQKSVAEQSFSLSGDDYENNRVEMQSPHRHNSQKLNSDLPSERINKQTVNEVDKKNNSKRKDPNSANNNINGVRKISELSRTEHSSSEKKCFYFGMEDIPSKVNDRNKKKESSEFIQAHKKDNDNIIDKFINAGSEIKEKPYKRSQDADAHFANFQLEGQNINCESSSVSSDTTELDIPILIRPTLPIKRQQLPKFSPSAAWRSLDSPSNSSNELDENISSSPNFQNHSNEPFNRRRKAGFPYQSGDSGISAGDASSPIGCSTIPHIIVPKGVNPQGGSWTPQQDLEGSSSELEDEEPFGNLHGKADITNLPTVLSAPHTPPKLAARKAQLFSPISLDESPKSIELPFASFNTESSNSNASRQQYQKKYESKGNDAQKNSSPYKVQPSPTTLGSGTNWYLSRSEPNLLNVYDDRILVNELRQREEQTRWKDRDIQEKSLTLGSEGSETEFFAPEKEENNHQSEIGYGPSSMNFNYKASPKIDEACMSDYLNHPSSNSNSLSLSHIMYLPSYDSRRISGKTNLNKDNNRKTKSMDNFLMQEALFTPTSDVDYRETDTSKIIKRVSKKKKFKYQSTLRVLERKRVERELTQEALEKEIERIQEIETMRRVEEEFMRKRMKEQNRIILRNQQAQLESSLFEDSFRNEFRSDNELSKQGSSSQVMNGNRVKKIKPLGKSSHVTQVSINTEERQEPEGAPASGLEGKRYRNGALELTEELTEFRKPSRQYCDYNSKHSRKIVPSMKHFGASNDMFLSRHINNSRPNTPSSSSKNAVIHPEIVCDIPNKPMPCTLNVSRVTMPSNDHYRPDSSLSVTSGPSSIISDNYRRDWVQGKSSNRSPSALNGRASSMVSLISVENKNVQSYKYGADGVENEQRFEPKGERQPISFNSYHNFDGEESDEPFPQFQNHQPELRGNKMSRGLNPLQPKPFTKYKDNVYRPIAFQPRK